MPITLIAPGTVISVRKIGGSSDVKQHLNELGFVEGTQVTVISMTGGNLIVKVKDSRIALNKEMANKILV